MILNVTTVLWQHFNILGFLHEHSLLLSSTLFFHVVRTRLIPIKACKSANNEVEAKFRVFCFIYTYGLVLEGKPAAAAIIDDHSSIEHSLHNLCSVACYLPCT